MKNIDVIAKIAMKNLVAINWSQHPHMSSQHNKSTTTIHFHKRFPTF